MLSMWIYKRFLLLLLAYGGVLTAMNLFPKVPVWAFSSFLGEVIFSPLKLLIAIILFVIGFLAYSLFVRDVVIMWKTNYSVPFHNPRLISIIIACVSWIHLFIISRMYAFVVLALALWYGIKDVRFNR
ncbi:hypothetical protein N0O92_07355 [Alkalihalobacillus sp. MEB130]|uniref:hypothetical protein n=1 Tax=Alkalihalobacillus sp. MEB130 TaxID=2976704 RepID=UPI0028DF2960|nr:hypothetical protein [Alkalihalobacillus sp. MEB130]MDT8860047.1 hypothetical protein [Alkalihalobacillus sp. MEB130]